MITKQRRRLRGGSIAGAAPLCLLGLMQIGYQAAESPARVASALQARAAVERRIPVIGARIIKTYPHDPHAFTQGLEYDSGYLYESTGRTGQSTLRKVVLETGAVVRKVSLSPDLFGEGLTIYSGKIYQLTWRSKKCFVYDLASFRRTGEFAYEFEGWGLTHDDTSLILSDGTNQLRFLDPATFRVTRSIWVYAGKEAVANLNELEYIDGEILANVWHSPRIARGRGAVIDR